MEVVQIPTMKLQNNVKIQDKFQNWINIHQLYLNEYYIT